MINKLLEGLNSLSSSWLAWCASSLIDSCVLLAVIGLVWLFIRRRASPQVGYCLFFLVLLKLIVPLNVTVPKVLAMWSPSTVVRSSLQRVFHSRLEQKPVETNASLPVRNPDFEANHSAPTPINFSSDSPTTQLSEPADTATPSATAQQARDHSKTITALRAELPLPAFSTWIMLGWAACVVYLSARLVRLHCRFEKQLNQIRTSAPSRLGLDLSELCRRMQISRQVDVILSDLVIVPAVSGGRSPVILLPRSIEADLSKDQLEWVLLHELAHVQRQDMWAVAFQRFVGVLYFFNPAVWVANRFIDQLREYACDDLAASTSRGSNVDFGQAFLRILQSASEAEFRVNGALGVFGFDSRATCFQRVRRLLENERNHSVTLDRYSLAALSLLAIILLPRLNAAVEDGKSKPPVVVAEANEPPKEIPLAKDVGEFDLQVIGPDGKPLSHASVFFYTEPLPTADQVRVGAFDKKGKNYGVYITASAEGRVVLAMPKNPAAFDVRLEMPGYGPYSTHWDPENPAQQIPARFTMELEAGWKVGGVVVGPDGIPVEGVEVSPSIEFKRRKDDPASLHTGRSTKTDAQGQWSIESVPVSMTKVGVELNDSRFLAKTVVLTRDEFELKQDQKPHARVVLDYGLSVTGRIVDEHDLPIEGARIFSQYRNALRETKSSADGTYKLEGCAPVMSKIVVSAKGKARDMQQVRIGPDMPPVNFTMQPGGKLRVRVLDDKGQPSPKARIFFQRWRGDFFGYFEFDRVNQYADKNGVWEWDEAPLDEFQADICATGGMQLTKQVLQAREEEYVFRAPTRMTVSGRVIDADTKETVKTFDVLPGFHQENDHLSWDNTGRFTAKDGTFRYFPENGRVDYVFRIEALGYRAFMSRNIQLNEGAVVVDVELQKAPELAATVRSPDGSPAANVKIAVGIPGAQIHLANGEISSSQTYCGIQTTDASGQFRVVAQDKPWWLVMMHPTGFHYSKLQPDESLPPEIQLTEWGQVEGVYMVGGKPIPRATLIVEQVGLSIYGRDEAHTFTTIRTVTDSQGRYRFDHVFPGQGKIGREIVMMVVDGAVDFTSSCKLPVTIESGKTVHVTFGESGRPVIGRFESANPGVKPDWKQFLVQIEPLLPDLPQLQFPKIPAEFATTAEDRKKWMGEWEKTEDGKAWVSLKLARAGQEAFKASNPYYRATLNTKGEFRFEDIPAGEYKIYQLFSQTSQKLSVPPMPEGRSDEPLDIGVLTWTQ